MMFDAACSAFVELVGTSDQITRIRDILGVGDDPIAGSDEEDGDNLMQRKKMKMWSSYEDARLLSGIYRYGVNNWAPISRFVGNSRTRAQCAQRWARGLNPRICKETWDPVEDMRLLQLVQVFGDKSWAKISGSMGNRSDVQCRYHYHQLAKDMSQFLRPFSFPTFDGTGEPTIQKPVRPFFGVRMTARSSMPEIIVDERQSATSKARRSSQFVIQLAPVDPLSDLQKMPYSQETSIDDGVPDDVSITHLLNRTRD
jgi:hypothetical protein